MRGRRRRLIYPAVGAVLLAVMFGPASVGGERVYAQSSATPAPTAGGTQWELHVEGTRVEWPLPTAEASLGRVEAVGRKVLSSLRRSGYYYASLDSVRVDSTMQPPVVHFYARRGPKVHIEDVRVTGTDVLSKEAMLALMKTEAGEVLRPKQLEADIEAVLARYEEVGRPLAEIRVRDTLLHRQTDPALRLTLDVEEGPALWLKEIDVPDDARTSPELVAQLADLEVGAPLGPFDPTNVRKRLRAQDFFESVGSPKVRVGPEGGATLKIPVEEEAPGSFDFMFGYLPPSRTRDSGQLVGSGHLLLRNFFGGGRTADLMLDRRSGRTSILRATVSDPYFLGLPLRVGGHFRGEQRDSTYGERTYELDVGYRMAGRLEATASISREVVRPGPAGVGIRNGSQVIPRSTTFFYGVGLQYRHIARPRNPRRGVSIDLEYSQGEKERRMRRVTARGDTTRATDAFRQERLQGRVRAYVPLFQRQVLAVGGEGAVLFSREYDPSDLFRLGGSGSLRGYDEDRFLGHVVGRAFMEYRLQLDRESYAFAFADLGYVDRPVLNTLSARQSWHPGYGVGVRLHTAIGRISTTYALNPEVANLAYGRIHLGLSVGL